MKENFSLYSEGDSRTEMFKKQKEERGFDDSELWCLYATISSFVLPRLKRFRDELYCYPSFMTLEQWKNLLDKMIDAFELADAEGRTAKSLSPEEQKRFRKGMGIFTKYFFNLWN